MFFNALLEGCLFFIATTAMARAPVFMRAFLQMYSSAEGTSPLKVEIVQ